MLDEEEEEEIRKLAQGMQDEGASWVWDLMAHPAMKEHGRLVVNILLLAEKPEFPISQKLTKL